MSMEYISNKKGDKMANSAATKEQAPILQNMDNEKIDFWNELPEHVKLGIKRGQIQAASDKTKTHQEVMSKYSKYL